MVLDDFRALLRSNGCCLSCAFSMESSLMILLANAILTYVTAYFGNMMPPIAGALNLPFGYAIAPTKLGRNKTYRGIYSGVIGGVLGSWLLWSLQWGWYGTQSLSTAIIAGGLMGFGALIGDAVKSGFKRWKNIP